MNHFILHERVEIANKLNRGSISMHAKMTIRFASTVGRRVVPVAFSIPVFPWKRTTARKKRICSPTSRVNKLLLVLLGYLLARKVTIPSPYVKRYMPERRGWSFEANKVTPSDPRPAGRGLGVGG